MVSDILRLDTKMHERPGGKVAVIALQGHIGPRTVLQLEDACNRTFKEGVRHVVLDAAKLEYMNSTGAALIVNLVDMFQTGGGSLQMAAVSKPIQDLLEVLGFLERVIPVKKTVQDALAAV